MQPNFTADELRQLLSYDLENGTFSRPKGKPSGYVDSHGRSVINLKGRRYYANRIAWMWVTGKWPRGRVWHKDGDPTNFKWSNLDERFDQV